MLNLNDLNPAQREAVELTEGPLLLLAGAGSGKTRVLTYRVANMIAQGADPWSILAITFTNKAAAEMRERMMALVGSEGKGLWVGTFHAVCMRILRADIENLPGFKRGFVIFDTSDQLSLLRSILKELDIDEKKFSARSFQEVISNAKNRLVLPREFERQAGDFFARLATQVYTAYQEKLFANNALDFDDIIMLTVRLFREYPQVLGFYQNRFRYILVDEYQDTNHAQYLLINMLANRYRNLCVVGDDDQSVYGWRGADISNILEFERDYPEATVLKLEQNYRSSGSILAVANAIVQQNTGRKEKSLWTEKADGDLVAVHRASHDVEEARYVVEQIQRLRDEQGLNYGDFAVLYRTNAQSRVLEERFVRAGTPYRVYSGVKFYERMEIKDLLSYLRLIYNPNDSVSFGRIVNVPRRGIGETSVQKLLAYRAGADTPLMELLLSVEEMGKEMDLQARAINSLKSFAQLIQSFREMAESGATLTELTQTVLQESGYWDSLKANRATEGESRLENIDEFLNLTNEFDEHAADYLEDLDLDGEMNRILLGGFLERVALVADIDSYEDGEDVVKFMTMHSAKGLEFPVVFLVGMEEGILPSSRSILESVMLEEERRLCYVAVTRAKERLFMLHARQRTRFGRTESAVPSRFLSEIPDNLKNEDEEMDWGQTYGARTPMRTERWGGRQERQERTDRTDRTNRTDHVDPTNRDRGETTSSQPERKVMGDWRSQGTPVEPKTPATYHVGDHVRHPSFGQGIVMNCRNEGGEAEVTVVFAGEIKKLLAAYARLEKLE